MDDSQSIVKEFLVESHENLDQLDRDLVSLEQSPGSRELLGSIFRTIHTIKGTCGFLGFSRLEQVAHVGENLLSKLRDGEMSLRPDITTGLLSLVDAVREMLANIDSLGHEGEVHYEELIRTLVQLQELHMAGEVPAESGAAIEPAVHGGEPSWEVESDNLEPASDDGLAELSPGQPAAAMAEVLHPAAEVAALGVGAAASPAVEGRSGGAGESTIRVDVGLLDKLMNQVGELVLARNQILQFTGSIADSTFLSTSQRLNLITTELQEGVMKTRMQPIGNIWSKFPRVVRDLAVQCGKQVRIEMEGKETELDKTIVEAIKDPLTHIVRNSVDHGIEKPEERLSRGKPAEGRLLLRAFHEGGQVNIEICDDGAGLNLDRIRHKAVERGLMSQEQALRLSDRDAAQLIFAPGFSTAAQVTNVSGRGVGMDVVRSNVEKIGGTVDVIGQPGEGTTVRLKIPLTLAIIPALVVTCGGDRYAIPQVSLLELVRLEGEQAASGIERIHGAPVYRLRGQLLPIVYLKRELGLDEQPAAAGQADVVNIVVLRADDRQFGLVVDSINDTEEIVVKPLGKQLKGIPVYAGATIMGDGKVALILDVLGTAQRARVVSEVRDRSLSDQRGKTQDHGDAVETLLIFTVGGRRMALPISMVSRLEEVDLDRIERADNREVVQYRGQILPLVRLSDFLGIPPDGNTGELLQVIVYTVGQRSLGLVVDRILDIVETAIDVSLAARGSGVRATTVIQQRVTEVLDLPAIVRSVDPEFFASAPAAPECVP